MSGDLIKISKQILLFVAGGIAAFAPVRMWAQLDALHATGPLPSFEVASVRPMGQNVRFRGIAPGTTNLVNYRGTVLDLMQQAYVVPSFNEVNRVVGGPKWMTETEYQVIAKVPDDIWASMQKMTPEGRVRVQCLMLQTLLAERFKLSVHFDKREVPIDELVLLQGGPKVKKVEDESTPAQASLLASGGFDVNMSFETGMVICGGKNMTLDVFAMGLEPAVGRPVVNRTALTGRFDLPLQFAAEGTTFARFLAANHSPSNFPSLWEALKKLGLKLQPAKGMEEFVVIEHIELPSEN